MCTEPVLRSLADFLATACIFWLTQLNGFAAVGLCSLHMVGTGQVVQHLPACPLVFPGVPSLGCGYKTSCCSPITCQHQQPCHQLLIRISHNGTLLLLGATQFCAGAGGTALTQSQINQHLTSFWGRELTWKPESLVHFDRLKSTFWCLWMTCAFYTGELGSMKLIQDDGGVWGSFSPCWRRCLASCLAEGGCNDRSSISKLDPRMKQGSLPQLTTGCPVVFKTKWLKWFRVSSLFQMANKGSCVWTKPLREVEAVRTHCTDGGGSSFVAANFPLYSVWSAQLSLPLLHCSSMAFHTVSSVLSCSKAQMRSSPGAKPHGLTPQHVGWLGNSGLRCSSRSCYQPPPRFVLCYR